MHPKDDTKHRADWRVQYDADERARFRELAEHAAAHNARFGFAISPGLDVTYDAPDDRAAIFAKLKPLLDVGVPWFLLLLDDIPMQPGLAPRQADLATWLFDQLRSERADASLTLCPTEYLGTRPSPYLGDLGAGPPTRGRRDVDRPDGLLAHGARRRRPRLDRRARRPANDHLGQHAP